MEWDGRRRGKLCVFDSLRIRTFAQILLSVGFVVVLVGLGGAAAAAYRPLDPGAVIFFRAVLWTVALKNNVLR